MTPPLFALLLSPFLPAVHSHKRKGKGRKIIHPVLKSPRRQRKDQNLVHGTAL